MKICCIGDSLTEGDYGVYGKRGIANVHEKGYPYFLQKLTCAEVCNFGKCGWRSVDMLAWYEEKGFSVAGSDVILLMLGTNGGQSAEGDSPDNDAYLRLIGCLQAEAPAARIYLCTPPHVTVDPAMSNCGYAPQVAEAVGFVRKTAKRMNLPIIDLAADPHFTDETEKEMQPNDGLHFTEKGYETLANVIYNAVCGGEQS